MTDDPNTMLPFTPETLEALAKAAEKLRTDALFGIEDCGADALAEQHFFLGLNALEQASHAFALARLYQVRALVATGRG